MIDPSLMPELPERNLPLTEKVGHNVWTAHQMKAYGLQCYQLAMERAADLAYDAAIRYSQGYAVDFKAEFALQVSEHEAIRKARDMDHLVADRDRLAAEVESMKDHINMALAYLGPVAPECSGCAYEWNHALKELRTASPEEGTS